MFKVRDKKTNKTYTVFQIVNNKCGYPHFLIFCDGRWVWKSAKHFAPVNIEQDTYVKEICANCKAHTICGLCTRFESELYGDYTSDDCYCNEFVRKDND